MIQDIDRELQEMKQQLALLKDEHAKTRNGWRQWLRSTGLILVLWAVSFLLGVFESHYPTSPVAIVFAVMALLMLILGLWLLVSSLKLVAEKMMSIAPSR